MNCADLNVEQVCMLIEVSPPELIQVIELGIVEQPGSSPDDWVFDVNMPIHHHRRYPVRAQLASIVAGFVAQSEPRALHTRVPDHGEHELLDAEEQETRQRAQQANRGSDI